MAGPGTAPGHGPDAPRSVVLAAGVVCLRPGRHGPEALLVHRPHHADWSWPKGKLDPGETLPECAVRETLEETGVRVVPGRPLAPVSYPLPDGSLKVVHYWAAAPVADGAGIADPGEIDETVWLPVADARDRLTHALDREVLDTVLDLAAEGTLDTVPVLLLRHATARPRAGWLRGEAARPLVAAGRRQARGLVGLLDCWLPQRVVSSPWQRCTQTLAPYAAASGARVRHRRRLTEAGFTVDPSRAVRQLLDLLADGRRSLLCSHRPVLVHLVAEVLDPPPPVHPGGEPVDLAGPHPGEVLVLHVARDAAGPRVVAAERHRPVELAPPG